MGNVNYIELICYRENFRLLIHSYSFKCNKCTKNVCLTYSLSKIVKIENQKLHIFFCLFFIYKSNFSFISYFILLRNLTAILWFVQFWIFVCIFICRGILIWRNRQRLHPHQMPNTQITLISQLIEKSVVSAYIGIFFYLFLLISLTFTFASFFSLSLSLSHQLNWLNSFSNLRV